MRSVVHGVPLPGIRNDIPRGEGSAAAMAILTDKVSLQTERSADNLFLKREKQNRQFGRLKPLQRRCIVSVTTALRAGRSPYSVPTG